MIPLIENEYNSGWIQHHICFNIIALFLLILKEI